MSDRKEIERLFKNNWDALCMFSLHFVGDMDTAEDVVMDCFLKLSERIGHGEDILTPKHYLYQMGRNGSLDKAKYLGQTVQLTEASRTSEDLDDVSERSVREARLWTAIDSLPPVRREVLLMSWSTRKNASCAARCPLRARAGHSSMTRLLHWLR